MKIYADTSVLVAWFHPADEFAVAVTAWCRSRSPEFFWNPLLRAELRHNLRRLSGDYAAVAWHSYRAAETSNRLRPGLHRLPDLLEWGDELSAAPRRQQRGWHLGFRSRRRRTARAPANFHHVRRRAGGTGAAGRIGGSSPFQIAGTCGEIELGTICGVGGKTFLATDETRICKS